MKKVLSLVAALATLAGTASAAPYYLPQPAGGALTPYDWQPVYSIDGIYNWGEKSGTPDTAGARLNFSLYSDANSTVRHQFTISAAYEVGSTDRQLHFVDDSYTVNIDKLKLELEKLPVTLGYDINIAISDHVLLDFGVKGGYAFGFLTGKVKNGTVGGHSLNGYKEDIDTSGFTYGLTAGIKIQFSEAIYARLAYEFARTYFTEHLPSHVNINQHGIVLGVGCTF